MFIQATIIFWSNIKPVNSRFSHSRKNIFVLFSNRTILKNIEHYLLNFFSCVFREWKIIWNKFNSNGFIFHNKKRKRINIAVFLFRAGKSHKEKSGGKDYLFLIFHACWLFWERVHHSRFVATLFVLFQSIWFTSFMLLLFSQKHIATNLCTE